MEGSCEFDSGGSPSGAGPRDTPWVQQGAFRALCCLEVRGQEELGMTLSLSNLVRATHTERASQVALGVKNPPADSGDIRNVGPIPGSGRSPAGGHGNPP